VDDFVKTLQAMTHPGIESLGHARQQQALTVDKGRPKPKTFEVGDLVLLSTKYIRPASMRASGTNKLRAKYIGPFTVSRKVSATAYELDLPMNMKVHPIINLKYLKGYHQSPDRFGSRATAMMKDSMSIIKELEDGRQIQDIKNHRDQKNGTRL
jgi:hypothetical protein